MGFKNIDDTNLCQLHHLFHPLEWVMKRLSLLDETIKYFYHFVKIVRAAVHPYLYRVDEDLRLYTYYVYHFVKQDSLLLEFMKARFVSQ